MSRGSDTITVVSVVLPDCHLQSTWKIENIPNELVNLDLETSRQSGKRVNRLFKQL